MSDDLTLPPKPFAVDPSAPPEPKKLPVRRTVTVKKKKGKPVFVSTEKMDLFLAEYLANNGNGTEAALKVFDTTNRLTAANIASEYLKKAQAMGKLVMEQKGFTYGKMLDIAAEKMAISKTPEWWDRLMKIGGYEDFMTKQGVTKTSVAVMEVQKELLEEFVEGEILEDEEDE